MWTRTCPNGVIPSPQLYTFTVPSGNEFICFTERGNGSPDTSWIKAYYRACTDPAGLTFGALSNIDSQSKILPATSPTTLSFTAATDSTCNSCGTSIDYSIISITPAPATPNLISLPSSTSPSITFAATLNIADAVSYTITVLAKSSVSTTCAAS